MFFVTCTETDSCSHTSKLKIPAESNDTADVPQCGADDVFGVPQCGASDRNGVPQSGASDT